MATENPRAVDKITYVTDAIPTWWMLFWIGYIIFTVSYIVMDWIPDFVSWLGILGQGAEAADKHIWVRELMRE